jgi:F420H(2)-dependent quinone reductase
VQVKLTTRGRRSGRPRQVTLYAFPDGDRMVVVGSRGGAAHDPAWALNLRADPRARLQRGRRVDAVRASEAEGAERERLWRLVCVAFPLYASYQRRTRRRLPVFVLEPADAEDGTPA